MISPHLKLRTPNVLMSGKQIDKVTSLTNKDPYKLSLAKSQGSFSRAIGLYPQTMG